jgi:hypothetical protein
MNQMERLRIKSISSPAAGYPGRARMRGDVFMRVRRDDWKS